MATLQLTQERKLRLRGYLFAVACWTLFGLTLVYTEAVWGAGVKALHATAYVGLKLLLLK